MEGGNHGLHEGGLVDPDFLQLLSTGKGGFGRPWATAQVNQIAKVYFIAYRSNSVRELSDTARNTEEVNTIVRTYRSSNVIK